MLSLAIIFYSEHVETKEITVKLLKIIKPIFKSTTNLNRMVSKMAEADQGPLGIRMVTFTDLPYRFILKIKSRVITLRNGFQSSSDVNNVTTRVAWMCSWRMKLRVKPAGSST